MSAVHTFLETLSAATFAAQVDAPVEAYFGDILAHANSDAGGVWLETVDHERLVLAWNVGGSGHEIEGKVAQPLTTGLVSKAFKEGQTICHRGFFEHKEHSLEVDRELHQVTAHQIATPFSLFGRQVGVLTAIQTTPPGARRRKKWGYSDEDIARVENAAVILARLVEHRVITAD